MWVLWTKLHLGKAVRVGHPWLCSWEERCAEVTLPSAGLKRFFTRVESLD